MNFTSFGQMIGCNDLNCEKEWFYYKYVAKRKWFSSRECEKNVGGSK